MSAYFLYLNEHRPRFVAQGLKVTEIAKAASVEWKALSPQQKAKYEDQAAEAKAKYEGDKAKYEASKSTWIVEYMPHYYLNLSLL